MAFMRSPVQARLAPPVFAASQPLRLAVANQLKRRLPEVAVGEDGAAATQLRLANASFSLKLLFRGAVAQLVERMVRNHEATGSSPVSSTSFSPLFLIKFSIRRQKYNRPFTSIFNQKWLLLIVYFNQKGTKMKRIIDHFLWQWKQMIPENHY